MKKTHLDKKLSLLWLCGGGLLKRKANSENLLLIKTALIKKHFHIIEVFFD